jgi:hypothetical protein
VVSATSPSDRNFDFLDLGIRSKAIRITHGCVTELYASAVVFVLHFAALNCGCYSCVTSMKYKRIRLLAGLLEKTKTILM